MALTALYRVGIWLYTSGIQFASISNSKARAWVEGRKDVFGKLQGWCKPGERVIWFHCASLGEFEQGRPVMESIKKDYPNHKLVVTFFSPSGYEIRKNYPGADLILYLPTDTPANAKRFLDCLRPELVVFVKYEFWYFYWREIEARHIPLIVISAHFRRNQIFFKPWGKFFRSMLTIPKKIFVQHESSVSLLQSIGVKEICVAGDTRYDRVLSVAEQAIIPEIIQEFCGSDPVLVCGSTWREDEAMLAAWYEHAEISWKMIIAPHEIGSANLARIEKYFPESVRYSGGGDFCNYRVLIIDNIGMLAALYKAATVAYVGGGFRTGLHNILEPAAHEKPVLFGPNIEKFPEASLLIQAGGGWSIRDEAMLADRINHLATESTRISVGNSAGKFIRANAGATQIISEHVHEIIE